MKTVTLTNDFHNTSARVRVSTKTSPGHGVIADLTVDQTKRVNRKLCGMSGCTCSGRLGTRGKQQGIGSYEPNQDGSVTIWGIK